MSDLIIFVFGGVVTLICSGAIGLLILGAHQDGKIQQQAEAGSPGRE